MAPGPEGTNLDEWRRHYDPCKNLTDMLAQTFGQPHPDREQPWLKIDRPKRIARVLFARSQRYRNPHVNWNQIYEEYAGQAVFVGTPHEHRDFQQEVGPVSYYSPTYLDLARVVAEADLVVVNQTSIRWLAEGFKVPVFVEVEPGINNTHWQRAAAYYLYGPSDIPALAELENIAIRSVVQRAHGRTLITDDRLEGGHRRGEFAADFDEVRKFLELYDVEYFRGAFPDAAPAANDDTRYAFVHLDTDTYQSTKAGLEYFLPRLVTDGVCVLDDYRWER